MANFNKVILAGNLTRDPQLSYTPSNTPVCEFGMAINRKWRDRDGNMKDEVCFVDINAYGRSAETINQYMHKGQPMLVEGHLRLRQWTNKEGQNRSKLDVMLDSFQFLGGPRGAGDAPSRPAAAPRPAAPADDNAPAPMEDDMPPPADPEIPF